MTLGRAESFSLRGPGGEYVVSIASPVGDAPPDGFPAIYVLDANAMFATTADAVRMRCDRPRATGVVPGVVVGIGYPTDAAYDRERRRFDFTSAPPSADVVEQSALHARGNGGATDFREFLERAVKPRVEAITRIDRSRQTLVGHSLGGLFVVETLLVSPAAFETYIAMSPSLWWDRPRLIDTAQALRPETPKRVMISVGEFEDAIAPWQMESPDLEQIRRRRAERRMISGARELAALLTRPQVDVRFLEIAGSDHVSTILGSLGSALRFALDPR